MSAVVVYLSATPRRMTKDNDYELRSKQNPKQRSKCTANKLQMDSKHSQLCLITTAIVLMLTILGKIASNSIVLSSQSLRDEQQKDF